MPKIPILPGKEIIKKLENHGYLAVRQKGSHVRLKHNYLKSVTVPLHKSVKPGLLHNILKDANLTIEQFLEL